MWPLLALSILSVSIILERLWFWTRILTKERDIVNRILDAAIQDWEVATEIARRSSNRPIGRFLYAPLRLSQPDPEVFRLALETAAEEELGAMRRGDKILEAVIALAPLLGLFGTVWGLIVSLRSIRIGDLGTGAASEVTLGIGEALISTAAGLVVAIGTLAFYRLFQLFLGNQVKIFRKSGNEMELLYRQFWAKTIVDYSANHKSTVREIPKPKLGDNNQAVENPENDLNHKSTVPEIAKPKLEDNQVVENPKTDLSSDEQIATSEQ